MATSKSTDDSSFEGRGNTVWKRVSAYKAGKMDKTAKKWEQEAKGRGGNNRAKKDRVEKDRIKEEKKALLASKTAMKEFLRGLFGKQKFVYQTFSKEKPPPLVPVWECVRISSRLIKQLIEINEQGMNIGVVPNLMDGKGRSAGNCIRIRWLFADFDKGEHTRESLLKLAVKPTYIVETSPGRFHVYWRVEDCSVEEYASIQKALAAKLGSDSVVYDPSRCMRLAGSLNHKYDPPFLAKVVFPLDGEKRGHRIKVSRFIAKMGLQVAASASAVKVSGKGDDKSITEREIDAMLLKSDPCNYLIWRDWGMALKSRFPGKRGLRKWKTYAKRCPAKYDPLEHQLMWDAFTVDGGITIGRMMHTVGGIERNGEIPTNELELAEALAQHGADSIRFGTSGQNWWVFNGVIWESSKNAHGAMKYARELMQSMISQAGGSAKARGLIRAGTLASAVRLAQLDPKLHIDETLFDADPLLLGLKNGVVDLRTGVFRQAVPNDFLTKQANVSFDPHATCPEFQATLKSICQHRRELGRFIIRLMGYTLTGLASEEKVFILLGKSGNGKGTLMGLLQKLLGDYAVSVQPNLLTQAYSGNPNSSSSAVMRLRGARLILCTELKSEKFDEPFFKQLSGGDALAGRENYAQQGEFVPVGKLWLSANDDPDISIAADAMWRRIVVLPFDESFERRMDTTLKERLAAEAPGVLNLMIKAARAYLDARGGDEQTKGGVRTGLRDSLSVEKATAGLRLRSDSVLNWLFECCEKREGSVLQSSVAYKDYSRFTKTCGKYPLGQRAFKKALQDKSYPWVRTRQFNGFDGLRLVGATRK